MRSDFFFNVVFFMVQAEKCRLLYIVNCAIIRILMMSSVISVLAAQQEELDGYGQTFFYMYIEEIRF